MERGAGSSGPAKWTAGIVGIGETVIREALIIGLTGGIGFEAARALEKRGWRIRGLHRQPQHVEKKLAVISGIGWIAGDAMSQKDVVGAASGASLIIHGANPPYYRNWRGLAIPMLKNTIAAAKASGARIVFPGNIYNFGPDAGPLLTEHSPRHPPTRKGAVRVEMEQMLREAADNGVRSLIVRAGDYFGPHGPSTNFSNILIKPGKPVRSIVYPGTPHIGHAWAYLPDLGETMSRLVEIEARLPAFETVHFAGHWIEPGIEMPEAIRRAAGNPRLPIRSFPWLAVRALSPFVRLFREVNEMRYLWQVPLRLDNRRLVGLIGAEPHTPLDEAVCASLAGLGCLPG